MFPANLFSTRWDFRLSRQRKWMWLSSGMLRCVSHNTIMLLHPTTLLLISRTRFSYYLRRMRLRKHFLYVRLLAIYGPSWEAYSLSAGQKLLACYGTRIFTTVLHPESNEFSPHINTIKSLQPSGNYTYHLLLQPVTVYFVIYRFCMILGVSNCHFLKQRSQFFFAVVKCYFLCGTNCFGKHYLDELRYTLTVRCSFSPHK
jgi:hypothetical protein